MPTTVGVIGSTGSIGRQTLEAVQADPDRYRVVAIAAGGSNLDALVAQIHQVRPRWAAVGDPARAAELAAAVPAGTEVVDGPGALATLAAAADVCVNGVVGFAGLPVTLGCLEAGRRLALANKESLIAAGPVVQRARRTPGAELVPVDSEHAAIHMCLRGAGEHPQRVATLHLTASGGPFRSRPLETFDAITIEDALAHPTWKMGPKITIDSATMMNKGLEVIEARWLFGVPPRRIDIVVHPESIVHSMVEYIDGSMVAQLGVSDMRGPISYALAHPERLPLDLPPLDLARIGRLTFETPDPERFPAFMLAYRALELGGTAPAVLSGADEGAVAAFLAGRCLFTDVADLCASALEAHTVEPVRSVEQALEASDWGRREVERRVARLAR